jgi:hypothetical protein
MAITGQFKADFSDFSRAVQAADVELRSFEDDSNKVAAALGRMADQFSGRRVIQEATLMVAAIEQIGGVTALTYTELQRMGDAAAAANNKMMLMGIQSEASMLRVIESARAAKLAMAEYGTQVVSTAEMAAAASAVGGAGGGNLGKGLSGGILNILGLGAVGRLSVAGGGLGVAAAGAIMMGRSISNTADEIVKMSDQTGMSTDEVQKLQYVAQQTSASIEALTTSVQNLQRGLGAGDKGLVKAVKDLNINFDDFKALSPWDQMVTLADAIGQVEDPTRRAAIAAAVFGKSWKETMAAVAGGMKDISAEAPIMSKTAAQAFDYLGDHIGGWWKTLKAFAADVLTSPLIAIDWMRGKVGLPGLFEKPPSPGGGGAGPEAPADTPGMENYKNATKEADEHQQRLNQHIKDFNEDLKEIKIQVRGAADELKKAAEEHDKFVAKIRDAALGKEAIKWAEGFIEAFPNMIGLEKIGAEEALKLADQLWGVEQALIAQGRAGDELTNTIDRYRLTLLATQREIAAEAEEKRKNAEATAALTKANEEVALASMRAAGMTPEQIKAAQAGFLAVGESAMRPSTGLKPSVFAAGGIAHPSEAVGAPSSSGIVINHNLFSVNGSSGLQLAREMAPYLNRVQTDAALTGNKASITR